MKWVKNWMEFGTQVVNTILQFNSLDCLQGEVELKMRIPRSTLRSCWLGDGDVDCVVCVCVCACFSLLLNLLCWEHLILEDY